MKWTNKPQPYPDDTGVRARMLTMPVESPPERDRAVRRCTRTSPLPGCAACSESEPCARHASFDLVASVGGDW